MRFLTLVLPLFFFTCPLFLQASPKETKLNFQLYFSPQDHLAEHLIDYIDKEETSLYIAIYSLTHRGIAEALVRAATRGVDVELIVDPFSVKARSPLVRIAAVGIPIYVWDPFIDPIKRKKAPLMHHKFCIFGSKSVWTGSFNFTYEADTMNCENALYIEDSSYAKQFLERFRSMKQKGCSPYEAYLTAHAKPKNKESKKF